MSENLAEKKCIPCQGGIPALKGEALNKFAKQLEGWKVVNEHHIEKEFTFDSYQAGVDFTNAIASLAESEGHHPDLLLTYGNVKVTVWTHKVDGLTESDFIFAAKTDRKFQS